MKLLASKSGKFFLLSLVVLTPAIVCMILWCSADEEEEMRTRYGMVRLGSTLSEAEASLGMSSTILVYDGDTMPETLDEERGEIPSNIANYYEGRKYGIKVYYDVPSERVVAKKLLALKQRSLFSRIQRSIAGLNL